MAPPGIINDKMDKSVLFLFSRSYTTETPPHQSGTKCDVVRNFFVLHLKVSQRGCLETFHKKLFYSFTRIVIATTECNFSANAVSIGVTLCEWDILILTVVVRLIRNQGIHRKLKEIWENIGRSKNKGNKRSVTSLYKSFSWVIKKKSFNY